MQQIWMPRTTAAIVLVCAGLVLFFYKVGDRDLWAPDEDEYAQMSREMIRTGNWIFPTVNGEPWAVKPVLYNWLIAAVSVPWGDVDEFRARIFSSLSALGTFMITFVMGRRLFSPFAGFLAALVLGTNVLFLQYARWSQTYMMSTFFMALAVLLFYRGYQEEDKRRTSYLLMYIPISLGVLIMGPVNLAMPGLVIFIYLVAMKDLKHIKLLRLGWGAIIFLAIAAPWYALITIEGGYAGDLLVTSNISRFLNASSHSRPLYYYIPGLFWAFAPWSALLPFAIHHAFSHRSAAARGHMKLLLSWFLGLLVFFSLADGKRHQYILPVYPALALLVGYWADRAVDGWKERYFRRAITTHWMALICLSAVLAVALPVGTLFVFESWFPALVGTSIIFGVFSLALWLTWKKRQVQHLILLPAALALIITVYSSHILIPKLENHKSPRAFCAEITSRMNGDSQWAMYRYYRAAYVYYTDSFTKVLHNQEQLEEFLDQPRLAVVATPQKEFDKVKDKLNLEVYILAERYVGHRKMVLLSNRDV